LRGGVGLLSCHVPGSAYSIMQVAIPEAMVITDLNSSFLTAIREDLSRFNAIGIGPGIGTAPETRAFIKEVLQHYRRPIVIDADALNILGREKDLLTQLPRDTILTPHPKEFERLFGESGNEFERIHLAIQKSNELNVVIVLKGHHTLIAAPGSVAYFNSTGNAGMATAGSGDVLTGLLTSLLAQGYSSREAAILGVYLHGLSGDLAAADLSMESMIAGDLVEYLPAAYSYLASIFSD